MPLLHLACLFVPLFPLAARLRAEPELGQEALAILAGNGNAARVVAANRRARQAGIRPGMTLPQARALVPKLAARGRDPECERAAQEALLEVADCFSPRVEDGAGGVVYLDLAGLDRHFSGGSPEMELGQALALAVEREGLPVRVGIAGSKLAARVAAELPNSPTVVPAGEETAFLAPLPLARLAPELELAATLERWGLHTVGEFARLPQEEVASRLGEAGARLHAIARGVDSRPLMPRQPPPELREGMDLEWPLVTLEPFLFLAHAALDRLCRRLESQGLGCARLGIALRLEPEGHDERALTLPAPTSDAKTLLTLVKLDLEARPPGSALVGFTFLAWPDRPRAAQLTLFGPADLAPDRLATTLARLFALLGAERVGSPHSVDGHRPERFALVPFAPPPAPKLSPEPRRGRGLLAVRVLRPPVALEVLTSATEPAAEAMAPPAEVHTPCAPRASQPTPPPRSPRPPRPPHPPITEGAGGQRHPPRIEGEVRVASGPWRIEEGWWSEQPVKREYWDIELAVGGLYRIFRDRDSGQWFADGIYD